MNDNDESFADRRQRGRERAGKLQAACEDAGNPLDWFDGLYKAAAGDVAAVPWVDNAPHPGLDEWLAKQKNTKEIDQKALRSKTAIDVGCGLGDNAIACTMQGLK